MTKRQDLCLQRRSRPEQSDQRQPNQPANISHQPRASPDSTSLASRIEFPTMTGSRRDLETLRAAINHHANQGFHRGLVRVSLPPKGEPRDRWLTRDEAAALIWHCWRYREKQTVHSGKGKGRPVFTAKRPLRHIARFILIGIYTGTRASAIAAASPYAEQGRSFVDLARGIFYRKQIGKRATKKRQTPAPVPRGCWPTCAAGPGQ